jgi:AcrR family transcriptional regulator
MAYEKDKKQKIFEIAIELFAQKGFAAVGIREIAKKANVNVSMVSYYFGGKNELLKEIINFYFDKHHIPALKNALENDLPIIEKLEILIVNIINCIKENPALAKVAIYEMPFNEQDIMDYKHKIFEDIKDVVNNNIFKKMPNLIELDDCQKKEIMMIVGPALISSVSSYFLLNAMISPFFSEKIKDKDKFFQIYTKNITKLFLNGFNGFLNNKK